MTLKEHSRNDIMDVLRAVAAMAVVLFHLNETIPFGTDIWQVVCKQGWLGVPVFFVISGWCMAIIVARRPSCASFLIARLIRIFPPYWISLITVFAVAASRLAFAGVNDVATFPRDAGSLLLTGTLLTAPATSVPTVNWVYWSLTYEVAFYLVVLLALITRRKNWIMVTVLLVAAAGSLVNINSVRTPFFFLDQYPLFAAGFFASQQKRGPRWIAVMALAAGAFTIALLPALVAGVAIILLNWNPKLSSNWNGLKNVGYWSYSLYLLHVPIGCYLLTRVRTKFILNHQVVHVAFDLGVLAILILLSAGFFRWIEQPSQHWGRRLSAQFRPAPSILGPTGESLLP